MNTQTLTKPNEKINPKNILGGILGGFDEIGFEMEAPSVSSVAKGAAGIFQDIFSLGQEVSGIKPEQSKSADHFPSSGSIEFNKRNQAEQAKEQKQQEVAASQRVFYQSLKDEQSRAQQAKERMLFEEEVGDISTNMPTDEKNRLLHYQSSYKDRSIYQKAELRKKIIEEKRNADKQQKNSSMAQTNPKASAMNAALEGGSGTQGGGQSNLSFQAAG